MPQQPRRATNRRWNWGAAAVVVCMLQILGIAWAVFIAAIDIWTTPATLTMLSLWGIVVAFGSLCSRSISNAAFGLSTLPMSVALVVLIVARSWTAAMAQIPVTATLISYELVFIPLGWLAVYHTLAPFRLGSAQATRRRQFSIAQSLAATTWVAVALGIGKAMTQWHRDTQIGIAAIVCVLTTLGIAIAAVKGLALIEGTGDSDSEPFAPATADAAEDVPSLAVRRRPA